MNSPTQLHLVQVKMVRSSLLCHSLSIIPLLYFAHTVPNEPRNLTVVASSSTSLQLTWERPLCEYGVIVNYTVSKVVKWVKYFVRCYMHAYMHSLHNI